MKPAFLHKFYDQIERRWLIGNRRLQPLFESMYRISLRGMNFGQVANLSMSGELLVLENIKRYYGKSENLIVFDVGANLGDYSLEVARTIPRSRIFSFEPSASTFSMLLTRTNDIPGIRNWNLAVGERKETRIFFEYGPGSAVSSFYEPQSKYGEPKEVSVIDIDSFCYEQGIEKINLLKIDVEGHELSVLKGASRMLKEKRIDFIQFEFGGMHLQARSTLKDIFEILDNYSISRIIRGGLRPYPKYDELWEIYVTANYLARLKSLDFSIEREK